MKAIYFVSFCFRILNSIREIRENKNLAKITTYRVACCSDGKYFCIQLSAKISLLELQSNECHAILLFTSSSQ